MADVEGKDTGSKASTRDTLRANIFGAKNKLRKSKIIDLFGTDIEIRQPTVGEISALAKQASADEGSVGLALALIAYAYVPDTNEKIFEDTDKDGILSFPADRWVDDLNKAIAEMTGVDLEEARKNLKETT